MKKIRFILPMMAVMVAVLAVFAFKAPKKQSAQDPNYIWINYSCDVAGNPIVTGPENYFEDDGSAGVLCPGGTSLVCAQRYLIGGPNPVVSINENNEAVFNPGFTELDYDARVFCAD